MVDSADSSLGLNGKSLQARNISASIKKIWGAPLCYRYKKNKTETGGPPIPTRLGSRSGHRPGFARPETGRDCKWKLFDMV
jgi:hypothetical protein